MKSYTVDLREARDFDNVVAAFNAGLISQARGKWNGNLNALHDYLSWPDEAEYQLRLLGWNADPPGLQCEYYSSGQTFRDVLLEVLADNDDVHVVCDYRLTRQCRVATR